MLALYRAILAVSWRRQIPLIGLSLAVAALAAVPLSYQKAIVNGLGGAVAAQPDALERLYRNCAELAALILLSLALKWAVGYLSGLTGENVIRVIRTRIHALSFDAGRHRPEAPPEGALVTMISAEAEEVGRFVGGAFSTPLLQLGTLVSVIAFIAVSQPGLGALAAAVILPQAVIVLLTQRQVNRLVADRVHLLRRAASTLTAEDLAAIEAMPRDFDAIYETRRRIFLWKLSTKFLLSALNGAGMVGILLLGGALVIEGETDVGTVVAATLGLQRLQQPWTQLVAFYRDASAVRVKFDLLRGAVPANRFGPPAAAP
ncbi:MAG: ABC transporter transmembrane domain-containing protein [Pseudomonadota bacterium]